MFQEFVPGTIKQFGFSDSDNVSVEDWNNNKKGSNIVKCPLQQHQQQPQIYPLCRNSYPSSTPNLEIRRSSSQNEKFILNIEEHKTNTAKPESREVPDKHVQQPRSRKQSCLCLQTAMKTREGKEQERMIFRIELEKIRDYAMN